MNVWKDWKLKQNVILNWKSSPLQFEVRPQWKVKLEFSVCQVKIWKVRKAKLISIEARPKIRFQNVNIIDVKYRYLKIFQILLLLVLFLQTVIIVIYNYNNYYTSYADIFVFPCCDFPAFNLNNENVQFSFCLSI